MIKGFQQREGIDYKETFTPVLNFQSLRTLLTLTAYFNLEVHHVDIKTTFLNSTIAGQANVYIDIPKEYEGATKGVHVLKLLKSLYRLKQAPRLWNEDLKKVLIDELRLSLVELSAEHSIFISHELIVVVYIDDIALLTKTMVIMNTAKLLLEQHYKITDLDEIQTISQLNRLLEYRGNMTTKNISRNKGPLA